MTENSHFDKTGLRWQRGERFTRRVRYAVNPPMAHTICIAAICKNQDGGDGVLLCTDHRLDYGSSFNNSGEKAYSLGNQWFGLFAGLEPRSLSFIHRFRAEAATQDVTDHTALNVIQACAEDQKRAWIDAYVTGKWGVKLSDIAAGQCSEDLLMGVSQLEMGTCCILARFFESGPRLFVVDFDLRGGQLVWEASSFAVIGSGSDLAQMALNQRGYHRHLDLAEASYLVFEAKKLGEKDAGVGPTTILAVLEEGGILSELTPTGHDYLENCLNRFCLQKFTAAGEIPADAFSVLGMAKRYTQVDAQADDTGSATSQRRKEEAKDGV